MLGDSSSVLAPPPASGGESQPRLIATTAHHDGLDVGGGRHRWSRKETLALLRIRSDMDLAFRDATARGHLWDEVSRKLAELGYDRSGKKCKEKFENLYRYHKRTKEGRFGKSGTKSYRFFDQLQALENHKSKPQIPESPTHNPPLINTTVSQITVLSTTVSANQALKYPSLLPPPPTNPSEANVAVSFPNISGDLVSNSTSSSTSSDVELEGRRGKKKWTDLFERLIKGVVKKQEKLQMKFFEELEKREQERLVREEALRLQEMARINREREVLAQERSIAASKDAAVMSFLQKLAQQNSGQPPQCSPPKPLPAPQPVANNVVPTSSSRWPKVEVEALIKIRTSLDSKYQENGPRGPLWEEISAEMGKIGYDRSEKRCKEKWENINKYYKKVKESNKKRPEDSKTCPYFYQLDALHRGKKKNKSQVVDHNLSNDHQSVTMPQNEAPLMVRPEQQWPPPPQQDLVTEDAESDQNEDGEDDDDDPIKHKLHWAAVQVSIDEYSGDREL